MSNLVVTSIAKEYATPAAPLSVLRDVSFELSAGESLAVVGPSGSGKSTLLYILGALERPTSGSITLGGTDPFSLAEDDAARFRNQQIGFVFQDHHLLPQLTVADNVQLPALALDDSMTKELADRSLQLIDRVGLMSRRTHLPSELSGGERQRVAVARALLLQPQLVLADEPTGNLDQSNAMSVTDLLLEMQSKSNEVAPMLIVVTHSQEVAGRMARQLALDGGRLVGENQATT